MADAAKVKPSPTYLNWHHYKITMIVVTYNMKLWLFEVVAGLGDKPMIVVT